MTMLDRPRLRVDFNEMVEENVVLLSRANEVADSSGKIVHLAAGMRVYLYMEDADEDGGPRPLLATGIVETNEAADWSSSVRWRCRIDAWEEWPALER